MNPPPPRFGRNAVVAVIEVALLAVALAVYFRMTRLTDRLTQEVSSLQAENQRLKQRASRASALPAGNPRELDRLRAEPTSAAPARRDQTSVESDPDGPLERVGRLKRYFARHPERGIPEMLLLTDEDWMQQAKDANLDTELGNRKALQQVRQIAQNKSGRIVAEAVKGFMQAHQGALPMDTAQLTPYLRQPEDAEFIALFRRSDEANPPVNALRPNAGTIWVFRENAVVDPWLNTQYYVGQDGSQGMYTGPADGPGFTVEAAVANFVKATGAQPTDASQLVPYLKDPVPTALLQEIFRGMQPPKA